MTSCSTDLSRPRSTWAAVHASLGARPCCRWRRPRRARRGGRRRRGRVHAGVAGTARSGSAAGRPARRRAAGSPGTSPPGRHAGSLTDRPHHPPTRGGRDGRRRRRSAPGRPAQPGPCAGARPPSLARMTEHGRRPPAPRRPATTVITAGRGHSRTSLAPALWASSTWESDDLDDANRRATTARAHEFYGRYANPTVRSFEEAIAELEGAEIALAFASGMGALEHRRARAVRVGQPHRRPAAAVRGHAGVPAGPVPALRHRGDARRRAPCRARSPRRCGRAGRCSCSPRRRRTRASSWSTSTSSARCAARSRSSTRRSPRRSASSRWPTACTCRCTRRRRASPGTTTRRSA